MLLYKLLHHIMVIVPKKVASQKKHKRIITIARSRFEILSPLTNTTGTKNYYKCLPHINNFHHYSQLIPLTSIAICVKTALPLTVP
jgi:hypothetical protein